MHLKLKGKECSVDNSENEGTIDECA